MSSQLATLLRKGAPVYRDLWIAQSREGFGTEPKAEVVHQHLGYWDAIAKAVDLPLNILIRPGLAHAWELKAAGVRRLSAGTAIGQAALGAARRAMKELLEKGRYEAMYAEAEGLPNMNTLLARA